MKKTLNLGCGDRTYTEYPPGYTCFNYDERSTLENVDVVGDVTDLSRYDGNEFQYILASDILEHFPLKYTDSILKEWSRVLSIGGTLELRVPNFEAIIRHYQKNKNCQHSSWQIYGAQDYSGNYHFVMFDEKWLREICEKASFEFISCKDESPNIVMKVKKV